MDGCPAFTLFTVRSQAHTDDQVPLIKPWKTIQLDPEYRGAWIVAGDLDGDGQAEVVRLGITNREDTHYTSSVVVHRLDGSVLWRWGDAAAGRNPLHHDVAAQVYDWDGDGKLEVIVAADQAVVELDGQTGQREATVFHSGRSFRLPGVLQSDRRKSADRHIGKDSLHADLGLRSQRTITVDVRHMPGGQRTSHQPRPVDLDGDGRDEMMAGYALLNSDGSVRWTLRMTTRHSPRANVPPSDTSTALGCLPTGSPTRTGSWHSRSAEAIDSPWWTEVVRCDGTFRVGTSSRSTWDRSVRTFPVRRSSSTFPMRRTVRSRSGSWTESGTWLGQILVDESRFHRLVDWFGTGRDSIIVGQPAAIFDGQTGRQQGDVRHARVAGRGPV